MSVLNNILSHKAFFFLFVTTIRKVQRFLIRLCILRNQYSADIHGTYSSHNPGQLSVSKKGKKLKGRPHASESFAHELDLVITWSPTTVFG